MGDWLAPGLAAAALLALAASPAAADGDGAYGRVEDDLVLGVAVGGGVALEPAAVGGAAALELRARYLDMAGLALAGELRPDGASRLTVAVDLRPVFLGRFLLGGSTGGPWGDLLLDSIGVELGVALLPLDARVGLAFAVGFGLEIPLWLPDGRAEGLFLRLGARHVAASATDQLAPAGGASDWVILGGLGWRGLVSTGLPSWEPRRYELPDGR